jgi:hypothetical protein
VTVRWSNEAASRGKEPSVRMMVTIDSTTSSESSEIGSQCHSTERYKLDIGRVLEVVNVDIGNTL